MPPLTQADLNRALLARQMLLARENISPLKAIERLAGMQAQQGRPPFVGLWTRLENFQRANLLKLFHQRRVVRATAMRATIHLFTAGDYLALRGALQPMLGAVMPPKFIKELGGESIPKICATGRKFFGADPRSFKDLRELLKTKYPKADYRIAALAVRMNVPLLGAPGDSPWGFSTNATWTVADEWLGQPVPAKVDTPALIKKCLAAFGPATPADAQAWSGCKGLRAEFEKLRPQLKVFQNEKGQELFDLPRARAVHSRIRQPHPLPRRSHPHRRHRTPPRAHHEKPPRSRHIFNKRPSSRHLENRTRQKIRHPQPPPLRPPPRQNQGGTETRRRAPATFRGA
jgi:hypothetical protein